MGRPIKKSYFANLNAPYQNHATGGPTGGGGEGIAGVTVTSGENYTVVPLITFDNTDLLPLGVAATAQAHLALGAVTLVGTGTNYRLNDVLTLGGGTSVTPATVLVTGVNGGVSITGVSLASRGDYTAITTATTLTEASGSTGTGATFVFTTATLASVEVLTAGSGYPSTPTAFVSTGSAILAATLTTSTSNGLYPLAWINTPGATAKYGDIMKQEGSRRYLVRTADGQGIVRLTSTGTVAVGEMSLAALDSANGTYYVKKLTARRAVVSRTGPGPWQFADGASVGWSITAAQANVSVKVASI